jgi:hypothetical protein
MLGKLQRQAALVRKENYIYTNCSRIIMVWSSQKLRVSESKNLDTLNLSMLNEEYK